MIYFANLKLPNIYEKDYEPNVVVRYRAKTLYCLIIYLLFCFTLVDGDPCRSKSWVW